MATATVTVGPAVTATLDADFTFIASGGSSNLSWSSQNATTCAGDIFSTSNQTSGSLSQSPPATTTYTLTCIGAGGGSANDSVTITVGPAVTATLTASIESIALGGSSLLTWDSANATSCTASSVEDPSWTGPQVITGGSLTVTPSQTATYLLSCVGPGDATAVESVTIAVGVAVSAALSADFNTIASGGTSSLSWLGAGSATSCSGDIFSTGGTLNGSIAVTPTIDTTYTLTCVGAGGASDVSSLTIVVGPPVTASLTVDINAIANGGSSTLTWSSGNATGCIASSEDLTWAGDKSVLGGSQSVAPTATATYELTCTGLGNSSTISSVTVNVGPAVTAVLLLEPQLINAGGSSLITWSSTNATSCAGDLFATGGAVSGSVTVTPTTNTTYTLTCTGPGNATEEDSGTVVVGPPVNASLTASPSFIAAGGSSNLSWNGENATTCTGDVFSTGGVTNSSLVVSPVVTTTYTVTCTGAGNATDTASVTITVGPSVTASLTANPTFIADGGTSTLSWTGGGGATDCTGDLFATGGTLSGTADVNPQANQTYTLTCTGPGAAVETASVTITVGARVFATLAAAPIAISPGGSTSLTWSGTGGATSCTGDLFATGGQTTGSVSVSPSVTTLYTVTCLGAGGASASDNVTVSVVSPVTVSLVANPAAIASGGLSELIWSSTGATSCVGDRFDTGSNPNGKDPVSPSETTIYTVTCTGLGGATASASATVTVGSAVAAILTADLDTIAFGGSTTLVWGSGNATSCTADSPQDPSWTGDKDIAGGSMVVTPVIDTEYTLFCVGAGGANDPASVIVTVGPAVAASLTATPAEIAPGGTSTLDWAGTDGATSCEGDLFSTASALAGSVDVTPTETTIYTVTCFGLGGATETANAMVTVGPPVQAQLAANVGFIALFGSSTLAWNSINATTCTAFSVEDVTWTGDKLVTGGQMLVSPIASSTYVLNCVGLGGAPASTSVTIDVGPAVLADLTASPTFINSGGSSTLSWTGSGGATSCSGDGFSTSGDLTGVVNVVPIADTTYTVTCVGAGGASDSAPVDVTVGPAVAATVVADFETIALDGSSTITWSSANATSCTASSLEDPSWSGDKVVTGGSLTVTPAVNSTYSLTCVGAGGAADTGSVMVTVGPRVTVVLTPSFTDIALFGSSTLSWSSGNAIACTASSVEDPAWTGSRDVNGGSLSVSPTSTSTYTLTCDGLGGQGATKTTSVVVNVGPEVLADLTASPTFINSGGSSTLSWTGSGGATSCTGDLFATGGQLADSVPVFPTANTTYTLTCIGAGGAIQTSNATVTVGPAVGVSLAADPEFIAFGGSTTLSWNSSSANACTASSIGDPSWSGDRAIGGGTQEVFPTVDSTYTLVCDGEGGASTPTSVTVIVGVAVTASLSADLTALPLGGSSTLSWTGGGGATSCSGTNFSTSGTLVGSISVTPAGTTDYVLTCLGAGGASAFDPLTIDVGAPITATLTGSPNSIALGGSSTLTWSSTDASSCVGVNFNTAGATTGSVIVSPRSVTTYSIICSGIGGAQSAQVNEIVLVSSAVEVNLTALPDSIAAGGSSTLAWTSANADTCVGTGFSTGSGDPVIGSITVMPAGTTAYTVTCTGDGGATASDSVTVSVDGEVLATLNASPLTIARGGQTTLTWDGSSAATGCTGFGFNTSGQSSGSVTVSPVGTVTYSVTCDGSGGVSDTADVTVTVLPEVDAILTAAPTTIALGGSSTLSWSSVSATQCTATSTDPAWVGAKAITGGTMIVSPKVTSTYNLTCDASGGTSDTASVSVIVGPAVVVDLSADFTFIALGGASTLTWTTANATSCTASSSEDPAWAGDQPVTGGSLTVTPGIPSTYTLTCAGAGAAIVVDSVTVDVGPAVAVTLTASVDPIALFGSSTLTWTTGNATSCTASSPEDPAWTGDKDVSGGSMVVSPVVNATYTLTCTGAGNATRPAIEVISVGPPVTVGLTASVDFIALEGSSTLTWTSSNAQSCSAVSVDPDWTGDRAITGGNQQVRPVVTTNYTLNCIGAGGAFQTESVLVTLGPGVVATLVAVPNPIAPTGTSTLSWTSENATSCVGDIFSTAGDPDGSVPVTLSATTTFTLTCIGAGGATIDSVETVVVGDAVTAILTANPTTVAANGTSTLSWSSQNASTCDGVGFSTGGLASGTVDVTLGSTQTTYTVNCTGAGNVVVTDNATVSIAPIPTVDLSASRSPIAVGGSSTLRWTSSATTCVGDVFSTGSGDPPIGSTDVVADVTTMYTVTCTDDFGQIVTDSVEVVVLPGPVVLLSADATSVQTRNPVELIWDVTGASSCVAFFDWSGNKNPVGGAEIVNPFDPLDPSRLTFRYTLNCTDVVGQSATDSVTVTIAPQLEFFDADPPSIGPGGSSSLIWNSNHADSCVASGGWSGVQETGPDTFEVSPIETTTYTLTCSGPGGVPDVASVTVIVGSPVVVNISVARPRIGLGQTTTLLWDTQFANSCTATSSQDPAAWFGPQLLNGSMEISPTVDSTYTLDCLGAGGAPGSGSVTVRIADALTATLTTSDDIIAPPPFGSATLTWSTAGDAASNVSCVASETPGSSGWTVPQNAPSGVAVVTPMDFTTYTLTCADQFYQGVVRTVTVAIAPVPTVTLTADKSVIATGGRVELTWTSTDAVRCSPTEAWVADPADPAETSGSVFVTPLETTIYEIQCFGLHPTPGSNEDNGALPVVVFVEKNRAVYNAPSWGEAVKVRSDGIALVASYEDGLRIVDASDNTAPVEIDFFDPVECIDETPFGPETVEFILEDVEIDELNEDLVYLSAGRCGIWTLDLGFVAGVPNPTLVSIVDTEGWTEHVTMLSGHAFVSDYNGGVLIFDLTDPAVPVAVANLGFDDKDFGAALEIAVVLGAANGNDYAYVASDLGLRIIDVTIPSQAFIVAELDTDVDNGLIPQGIVVDRGIAYLSSWSGGLLVIDVGNPNAPLLSQSIATDYAFYKLVADPTADLLYVAEGTKGIRVLDIANAGSFAGVITVDQIDIGKFVWDIGRANGELFVGFGDLDDLSGGFQTIIDRF